MNYAKLVTIVFASRFKLSIDISPNEKVEIEYMPSILYSSVVDSIMYTMVCTYFKISHTVNIVSRYIVCPEKDHWQAMK